MMKTFNLLSIGQRGVGKTVFLAGSYAESHSQHQSDRQQLWFDSQDIQVQGNLENILNYITRTGQYPPPTMKVTDFSFSLKRQWLGRSKTLCHFRWHDIPGELCDIHNSDFQRMVLASHGCCVFINADALVHDAAYLKMVEDVIDQVAAIASLVSLNNLKYAFALIFTQCDRLESNAVGLLQVEQNLQSLITRLDASKANYRRFYSAIPIVATAGSATIKPKGAAAPLLWLTMELRKIYQSAPATLAKGSMQGLSPLAGTNAVKKLPGLNLPLTNRSYAWLGLAGLGLLGAIAAIFFSVEHFTPRVAQGTQKQIREYEQVLQREPNNATALIKLANLHIQLSQPNQAVPLMEKLVEQDPKNLDLNLNLAQLYELTSQKQKAEVVYDEVLVQEKNNLTALISKAMLRAEQGDTEMAKMLFGQAEKAAPDESKPKIRNLAQSTLQ